MLKRLYRETLMKLEAMMEERRIFKCWFHHHITNGHQFTMSNRYQELASLEQTTSGKETSNPFMAGADDENPPPLPVVTPTQQDPHIVSTIKLPILKKGEYDIWAMKMKHYLAHTDYPIWEVIQRGNGPVSVSTDTNGQIKVLPPKTAEEILAREKERKARTTLLMAIPEDHLAKFHKMTYAKEMWDAIKFRFGSNDESKKMQKYILKQQFKGFSVSNLEGLYKGYDRFQSLLSQLKIHGAGVSTDDANQKFLRVFETHVKGSTRSSSSAQNVAFVSSKSISSTNDVSTAYGATTSSRYNPQRENSSSYTDELMHSFFANQSSGPQIDHEDLEQIDEFDLEEMDFKWQVAMISIRLKKFYKKTGRKLQFDAKESISFDKTKVECFNCHKTWHFARECRSKGNQDIRRRDAGNNRYKAKDNGRRPGKQEEPKAFLTLDGDGVDWTGHVEDEQENFALMAYSHSGSDTEVTSCSKECEESYAKLKKLYDEQTEQLGDASIEIKAYTLALAKMSVKEKISLGFSEQVKENELYDEALISVFDSHSSDIEDAHVYDRFEKVEGMHVVPPPMTGNYMPPKFYFGIDESYVETLESVPKLVVIEPKVVSQPKVWSDAHIIEEYESDSNDEYNPKVDKRDWNGLMSKKLGLGYGFTRKTCFVCGSFGHLIRDCDFHEKRMAKHVELNKKKSKGTGQGENRPVWNNVQILNHQNKFVPTTVLIRTGRFLVNTARHNFNSQSVSTSAARKANAIRPIVNDVRPRPIFNKTNSPIRRPFNRTTAPKTDFLNQKVNTSGDKVVSVVGGIEETGVKTSEVELQAEVERERQREEQASMDYIENLYDEVQVRIDADHELAVRLTHEEQEKYTMDERAKLLAEFCERRKKQLVEERSAAIRNKPLTRTQLRSLMMTYLKHTGRFKHSQLNKRTLEEIQAIYIKEQERAANFVPIGSEKDERLIQKMNKKEVGVHVEKVLEEPNSTRVEVKQEAAEQGTRKTPGKVLKMKARKKRKGGPIMKRQSKRKKTDSDLEEEEHLKTILKMVPDEEGIIDFKVLEKRFPIINWESKFYHFDKHEAECIYYMIFRSDESSRWIKTFSEMVTRFDRLDLVELYNVVMQRFETTTPEGVDLVLWGDLRTIFEANVEDELWQNQEGWNLKSWDFYENCGVHTLTLEDGTKIYMLAERRYPLTKETLERMMSLKLIAKSASDSAYDLLRFIQKQIYKAGSHNGGEKDL
ncbi:ribonuclease H-like domain-containing protein [Tanacetum coccineum]